MVHLFMFDATHERTNSRSKLKFDVDLISSTLASLPRFIFLKEKEKMKHFEQKNIIIPNVSLAVTRFEEIQM